MKRILLALLPLTCLAASAAHIGPEAALQRALAGSQQRVKGTSAQFRQIPLASAPSVYLFQGPDGFAVMPADDVAPALLGYGSGRLSSNPEFDYFMEFLSGRVELVALHPEWAARFERPEREPIAPLCRTKWNQGIPYNNECPTDDGQECYTGCVATSTAQLMKYFNWPPKAEGSGRYYLHFGQSNQTETEVDLSTYIFDWDNMLDEYDYTYDYDRAEMACTATATQQTAVAHLMAAVGAGVGMMYGTSGSGAYSVNVGKSLIENFGFSKGILFQSRDFYTLRTWEDMMYENLKNCGPIVYDGQNDSGAHSFICDGYAGGGLFHINWGWGGVSDGNFLLDVLDPAVQGAGGSDAGYSTGCSAVLGAKPATEADPGTPAYYMRSGDEGLIFSPLNTRLGSEDVFYTGPFFNYGPNTIPATWYLAMMYKPIYDPANVYDLTYEIGEDLPMLYGWNEFDWIVPSDLEEGVYKMYIATSSDCESWWPVRIPALRPQYAIGEIDAGGGLTLRAMQVVMPEVSDMDYPTEINLNDVQINVTGTVFNPSSADMRLYIRAEFIQDGKLRAYGNKKGLEVPVGQNVALDYQCSELTAVETSDAPEAVRTAEDEEEAGSIIPVGEYKLTVSVKNGTDGNWIPLSDLADVSVTAKATSGVDSIQADRSAVWFDLQGRRVDEHNLMPGVYIRKTAEGAEKIVIR